MRPCETHRQGKEVGQVSNSGQLRGIIADDVTAIIPAKVSFPDEKYAFMYEGTAGFWAGPSGVGKSLALARLAAWWSRTRGGVCASFAEDPQGMTRYRLEASGADMSKIRLARYMIPGELDQLEEDLLASGETLVIVDTAKKHIQAPMTKWAEALDPLTGLLDRTGAVMILTHHTIKNVKKGADWRAAVGGSAEGLVGTCRWGVLYGNRPDDAAQTLAVPVKDQFDEESPALAFEFDQEDFDFDINGKTVQRPVSYLRIAETGIKQWNVNNAVEVVYVQGDAGKRGPDPEARKQAFEFITEALKDGARTVKDAWRCDKNPDGVAHPSGDPAKRECGYIAGKVGASKGQCPYCGGSISMVRGLMEEAEGEGISWGTVKRAAPMLPVVSAPKGSSSAPSGVLHFWRLPDGHPKMCPNYVSVLP